MAPVFRHRKKVLIGMLIVFLLYFSFCLPKALFDNPTSTVLEDKSGRLMSAKIADDGQWRFPECDSVPYKFKQALLAFEDRNFESHPGVHLPSVFRAAYDNIRTGRIVSGGSTITMQVARMSRGNNRTFLEKFIEMIWAFRMEMRFSKEEILEIYTSNAPFGGNVVGLDAASWRYYGLPAHQLSWAESVTLAVLPNVPSLIYPGKNQERLMEKRNRVLEYLLEEEVLDSLSYSLALDEPLPGKPLALPMHAKHLLNYAVKKGMKGQRIHTSVDMNLQLQLHEVMQRYQSNLNSNYIHNAALLVIDVKENKVISYIGNTAQSNAHSKDVDLIHAPRSTGSILKPFLFASMLKDGEIHNEMLIPDVPMRFKHFAPKNFVNHFDGAVPAKRALSRSLNVPAVYLLREHGLEKFLHTLKKSGQKHLNKSADYYGLSLILGGGESTLWDIAKVYSGMARTLLHHPQYAGQYDRNDWKAPTFIEGAIQKTDLSRTPYLFDAPSVFLTFEALVDVNRPGQESAWRHFSSSQKIAWKTGTSFGNRDAWAVGCTPDYVVAVWVGNASGEGRPGLVGAYAAAPVMLDVFSRLDSRQAWFQPPHDDLIEMTICAQSKHRNTPECKQVETILTHSHAQQTAACQFHQTVFTDEAERYRFFMDCKGDRSLKKTSWFVLPPLQEWYYKTRNPNYKALPPLHENCLSHQQGSALDIVYPMWGSQLVLTKDLSGQVGGFVFEIAHRMDEVTVFWHLDNEYLGSTRTIHKLNHTPEPGKHRLTVVDEFGQQVSVDFEVLDD